MPLSIKIIHEVIDYINLNIFSIRNTQQLADYFKVSYESLMLSFKIYTGIRLKTFLLSVRFKEITRKMLNNNNSRLSGSSIAFDLGLDSRTSVYYIIKRKTGLRFIDYQNYVRSLSQVTPKFS